MKNPEEAAVLDSISFLLRRYKIVSYLKAVICAYAGILFHGAIGDSCIRRNDKKR
ncbi:MAG: hypothetical protein NT007_12320 [Candidatus Kapabacteria bacterium]|nr:hypothetical protein [Candidatus Kapabacteria bacterium]